MPHIVRFLSVAGGYNPATYEPKDFSREDWLASHAPMGLHITWDTVINVALVLLVALVWLTVPELGAPRRR